MVIAKLQKILLKFVTSLYFDKQTFVGIIAFRGKELDFNQKERILSF